MIAATALHPQQVVIVSRTPSPCPSSQRTADPPPVFKINSATVALAFFASLLVTPLLALVVFFCTERKNYSRRASIARGAGFAALAWGLALVLAATFLGSCESPNARCRGYVGSYNVYFDGYYGYYYYNRYYGTYYYNSAIGGLSYSAYVAQFYAFCDATYDAKVPDACLPLRPAAILIGITFFFLGAFLTYKSSRILRDANSRVSSTPEITDFVVVSGQPTYKPVNVVYGVPSQPPPVFYTSPPPLGGFYGQPMQQQPHQFSYAQQPVPPYTPSPTYAASPSAQQPVQQAGGTRGETHAA